VLEEMKTIKRAAWVMLQDAQVASVQGKVLTLSFTRTGNERAFTTGAGADFLNDALNKVLGATFEIRSLGGAPQLSPAAPTSTPASTPVAAPAAPTAPPPAPAYEGFAPGDEIEPIDPEEPEPERAVAGEDAALALLQDQLGASVIDES
jgi:DNA polymerase-3 subunit gamma/tau